MASTSSINTRTSWFFTVQFVGIWTLEMKDNTGGVVAMAAWITGRKFEERDRVEREVKRGWWGNEDGDARVHWVDFGSVGREEEERRKRGRGGLIRCHVRRTPGGAGNQAEPAFFLFFARPIRFTFGPVQSGSLISGPVLKLIQPIFSVPGIFHYFSRIFSHFFKIIQNLQNKIKSNKNLKNMIITSIK